MWKRGILLGLALLLTGSLMACKDTPDTSSIPDSTVSTEQPVDYDFGNRTFYVVAQYDYKPVPGDSEGGDKFIAHVADCEAKYNFKLDYKTLTSSTYHDVLSSSALANEYIGDIWYAMAYNIVPGYAKAGIVYALDDYNVFDFSEKKWIPGSIDAAEWQGKHYGFQSYGVFAIPYQDTGIGVFWNKDFFEREGLESLYDLVDRGEWTWDKLMEIATAATKDTDGDGQSDQWGLANQGDYFPFLASNGAAVFDRDETGKWVYTLNSSEAVEALEFFFNCSASGVNAPWLGDWQSSRLKPFKEGKVAMFCQEWWANWSYLTDMEDDYGWVPFPVGPSSDGNYHLYRVGQSPWVIPKSVQNPEQVMQMYDLISNHEDWENDPDAYRKYIQARVRDEETLDLIGRAINENWNAYSRIQQVSGLQNLTRSAIDTAWGGDVSAKTAVDSVADAAQQLIDETFNA